MAKEISLKLTSGRLYFAATLKTLTDAKQGDELE